MYLEASSFSAKQLAATHAPTLGSYNLTQHVALCNCRDQAAASLRSQSGQDYAETSEAT